MTALWLVRHARPLIERGRCYGALDIAADATHTQQVAQQLAALLPRDIALRSSPRQRCLQLSRALCALRPDLSPQIDPDLAEMDFGRWEGQHWDQLDVAELTAWTDDFAHHRPGGGESVAAFMERVGVAWARHRQVGATAVWLTHAGVIRAASLLAQGLACPTHADQWPASAPGYGEWWALD